MPNLRRSQRLHAAAHDRPDDRPIVCPSKRRSTDDVLPGGADQPAPKRLRLTKENLNRQQRLQNSRDQDVMGRARKTPSSVSKTTITTTDKQFASRLTQNGVVHEVFDAEPPDDADQIKTALLQVRDLPSLARRDWEKIREAKRQMAQGELSLESMIVESMLYHHDSPYNYLRYRNDSWTEVDNEITAGISDPKPDVTEAYTWSAYPPGTRENVEELVPSQYGYAMPTFAMESKGSGDHEQAVKQAAYDGAVMTHAALAIDGHVGESPDYQFRKTKSITMTLSPVEINVYANHCILEQDGKRRVYHQYRLVKVLYLDSEDEWNKAHMVVSNAQDFALELAKTRVKALWDQFQEEKVKQEQMKAKNAQLQTQALAETKAAMAPPPPRRKRPSAKNPNTRGTPHARVKNAVTLAPLADVT